MKATIVLDRGVVCGVLGLLCWVSRAPAAADLRRTIRVNPTVFSLLATNRPSPPVKVTQTNQALKVTIPASSTLVVRRGNDFVRVAPVRLEGTNHIFELKPTDVYVARGSTAPPIPLSTNNSRMPDAVRGVVSGREIEGHIEVALQSELMVYNPAQQEYEGTLAICFRSSAPAPLAQGLLPLALRLSTSPGLRLATYALVITNVGNAGCHDVPIQCAAKRAGAKVTVKSDAVGDQEFTIEFERPPFVQRFKTPLLILAGVALGGLGGLVRTWHPPKVRRPWKRIAEGGFCGLILVLLGQFGVQRLFQIEGPVSTSVVLGLCGVLGYLGASMFERVAPGEPPKTGSHSADKTPAGG